MGDSEYTGNECARALHEMLGRAVVGQEEVIDQLLVALFSRGHALIEGVPGTAKTMLVRALALSLGRDFRRIQFTPDLMPSDITGTNVLEISSGGFHLRPGPIFTSVLLADEINRAPAKTQSALLEGMQERQVTIDGVSHPLSADFTVFATQNPVEYEGTYPLPEAQLDRFMLKIVMDYPAEEQEVELLRRRHGGFRDDDLPGSGISRVADDAQIRAVQAAVATVTVSGDMLGYLAAIVRATRAHPSVVLGASPRAGVMLLEAIKVTAALRGRDFAVPDDVKDMAAPVLRHRLLIRPEAEIEGLRADNIIEAILASVPVPR